MTKTEVNIISHDLTWVKVYSRKISFTVPRREQFEINQKLHTG